MGISLRLGFAVGLLSLVSLIIGGCAGVPQFEEVPDYVSNQVDPESGEVSDPENVDEEEGADRIAGFDPIRVPPKTSTSPSPSSTPTEPAAPPAIPSPSPSATCNEMVHYAQITPSATRGANIVFLIDDSGSMDGEIAKVVDQIQIFINAISAATQNNYRIALIFNTNVDAPRKLSPGVNPFAAQLANPRVKYIEQRTWSKWADIAFYRAFAPLTLKQTLPSPVPVDRPYSGASITQDQCSGTGRYFRPRDYQSNFFNTPGCISAVSMPVAIEKFLLPNIAVNVIAVSDDDLNVAFDRNLFDKNDPTKLAYPEITYLMIKDILAPLGAQTPFVYHSIVGLQAGEPGVELVGKAHLALSKKTGGGIHSITSSNYQPIFEDLQENIIFSEKSIKLTCSIRTTTTPEISFNGTRLDASHFTAVAGDPVVRFKPSAFEGLDPNQAVNVRVRY